VQLIAGYIDSSQAATRPPTDEAYEVAAEISHRLFMSIRGFALLKSQLDEAAQALAAQGIDLDALNPLRPPA
jgi:hypothetical protein